MLKLIEGLVILNGATLFSLELYHYKAVS